MRIRESGVYLDLRTGLLRDYSLLLFCILFTKMHRCINEMNGEIQESNDCK